MNVLNKKNNPFLVQSADGNGVLNLHQKGSFLDKGLTLFESDSLTVVKESDGYNFTLSEITYFVSDDLIIQGFLYQAIQEGKLQSHLFNAALGFGSQAQARYKGDKVDVDILEQYQELISTIDGIVEREPKSKWYTLSFAVSEENHKLLIDSDFILGEWITAGVKIAGIKFKLPKKD